MLKKLKDIQWGTNIIVLTFNTLFNLCIAYKPKAINSTRLRKLALEPMLSWIKSLASGLKEQK